MSVSLEWTKKRNGYHSTTLPSGEYLYIQRNIGQWWDINFVRDYGVDYTNFLTLRSFKYLRDAKAHVEESLTPETVTIKNSNKSLQRHWLKDLWCWLTRHRIDYEISFVQNDLSYEWCSRCQRWTKWGEA